MPEENLNQEVIRTLGDYYVDAAELDVKSFAKRHGGAFLVHHGPLGKIRIATDMSSTQAIEHKETARAFDPGRDFLVFPLATGGAGGTGTIKLGRGGHNDVVVPDASISDDHAIVEITKRGTFRIQDLDSRNGTYVQEQKVPAKGVGNPVLLESGTRIRIGGLNMTFMEAAEFHNLVIQLLS
jgi:hypothetical protein